MSQDDIEECNVIVFPRPTHPAVLRAIKRAEEKDW